MAAPDRIKRCAVYTRKSSEEGLEQDFNSLHAQREACEAFIKSQRGEGWQLVTLAYDDGGISGGTMERPALQRLLADIADGRVDVIVVYKVDRLTRSLSDFARMVEVFDRHGVSFVAVTQQFNTTTSMGRLTLNVLLSFAQFEREVTGERIRDKIAASKQKGMWMGGPIPLGYRVEDRKLIVVPEEADRVRVIYQLYLECSGVTELGRKLRAKGIQSKSRNNRPASWLSRGALYALLANPIYIGQIVHKALRYPGQHEAIVEETIWTAVQNRLKNQASCIGPNRSTESSPLIGKLIDDVDGARLTPSHSVSKGKRYRYYVSPPNGDSAPARWRLRATEIEHLVKRMTAQMLDDPFALLEAGREQGLEDNAISGLLAMAENPQHRLQWIKSVRLGLDSILITLAIPFQGIELKRTEPLQLKRRGIEQRLVLRNQPVERQDVDNVLIKAIGRGMRWWDLLMTGQARSASEIAKLEGVSDRYVSRHLPLALLAPEILKAVSEGRTPPDLTAESLLYINEWPTNWSEQRARFGFA